ncbi:hypothetical protein Y032_0677g1443 [Ancylostoma ceylanicum]|uniref:VWFA domain-containing protein n=1 Tax=Ancylostoma ceylanicum TaxID=53326 RepID=A0A016WJC9_9BILA|nr:hypothetical protein Y032_0677g1443 [Ancylostoma ceylanicum]
MTSYLIFLACTIRSSMEASDASVRALKILPNGYAASIYDFHSKSDYQAIRSHFPPSMCRTTTARITSYTRDPPKDCKADVDFERNRKRWTYYGPNSTSQSSGSHWLDGYPAEMCADLPPTTGALLDGMVDVPAIARRPIICTYGNPPNLPALHPSDQCNKAAHYDEETKRCLCNNPEKDGRIYDPEKYGHYPEGIVCIDCANTTRTRSIVFILDNTGTVGESGWKAQKEFMMKVMKAMKNIRVGLVILSGDPHVEIPMDYFENNRKKFE